MSYQPPDDNPLETLAAIIIGSALLLALLFTMIGCSTTKCPQCVPEIKTVEIKVPVRICEPPPEMPLLALPEYPKLPMTDQEEDMKEWYARVLSTLKTRTAMLYERINTLETLLEAYSE